MDTRLRRNIAIKHPHTTYFPTFFEDRDAITAARARINRRKRLNTVGEPAVTLTGRMEPSRRWPEQLPAIDWRAADDFAMVCQNSRE